MVYRGHIKNGVVVLDEPVDLPEGTEVRVEPVGTQTLADCLRDIIGKGVNLPEDLAENHDHYLYGTPKK